MSDFRVASRYAKSLLELTIEQKLVDKIKEDMQLIVDTCDQNRDLVVILKNPIIKYDKKLSILKRVFQGKVNDIVIRFFELLARKSRAAILPDIASVWIDLYNEHKNIVLANVTSAAPLSAAERKRILDEVTAKTGKSVVLDEEVKKELIGGFVLTIKDTQLDNSVAGQLNSIKRKLLSKV